MPFEAARAIAATFCWSIRYALTPVFGRDFPALCIPPDSEEFGEMIIDSAVTRRCTDQAKQFRLLESPVASRDTSSPASPLTPLTPTFPHQIKRLRRKAGTCSPSGSGYSTDNSAEETYSVSPSPQTQYKNVWTPVNTPRSVPQFDSRLPSPREILTGITAARVTSPRAVSPLTDSTSPPLSPKSHPLLHLDRRHFRGVRFHDGEQDTAMDLHKITSDIVPSDEKAAYLLMTLKLGHFDCKSHCRGIKRRASA